MRAGKLLVDSALADPLLRWELTLPALYAYRHAIELGLKWTLVTYRQAFDVDCPDLHATHSLKDLWDAFQQLLDAISHPGEEEGNRAARRVVMAFHEWNKQGAAFRYAVRTDGRDRETERLRLGQHLTKGGLGEGRVAAHLQHLQSRPGGDRQDLARLGVARPASRAGWLVEPELAGPEAQFMKRCCHGGQVRL
jgi:hypothetical protein